jgi:hypothetical protein
MSDSVSAVSDSIIADAKKSRLDGSKMFWFDDQPLARKGH